MVTGQVYNSSAIGYRPNKSAKWYLGQAGGPTQLANKGAAFVIRADGSVISSILAVCGWKPHEQCAPARRHGGRSRKSDRSRSELEPDFAGGVRCGHGGCRDRIFSSLIGLDLIDFSLGRAVLRRDDDRFHGYSVGQVAVVRLCDRLLAFCPGKLCYAQVRIASCGSNRGRIEMLSTSATIVLRRPRIIGSTFTVG